MHQSDLFEPQVLDDREADGDRVWRLGPHGLAADTD